MLLALTSFAPTTGTNNFLSIKRSSLDVSCGMILLGFELILLLFFCLKEGDHALVKKNDCSIEMCSKLRINAEDIEILELPDRKESGCLYLLPLFRRRNFGECSST